MSFFKRLYEGWLMIALRFGATQTQVILAFFYTFLIGPAAVISRLAGRDLLDKHRRKLRAGATAWRDADSAAPDLERAKLTS